MDDAPNKTSLLYVSLFIIIYIFPYIPCHYCPPAYISNHAADISLNRETYMYDHSNHIQFYLQETFNKQTQLVL